MKIEYGEVYVPRITFSTDPDVGYIDAIEGVQEAENLNLWFTEKASCGQLPSLLFPMDTTAVMHQEVSAQVEMLTAQTKQMSIAPAAASLTSYACRGRGVRALSWSKDE